MQFTRLYREQHDRLEWLLQTVATARRRAASPTELRTALARLSGSLVVHAKDEEERLYPRLLTHADPVVRDTAAEYRATMDEVGVVFRRFYAAWSAIGAIEQDPAAFALACDDVCTRLRQCLDAENAGLFPLAERHLPFR